MLTVRGCAAGAGSPSPRWQAGGINSVEYARLKWRPEHRALPVQSGKALSRHSEDQTNQYSLRHR